MGLSCLQQSRPKAAEHLGEAQKSKVSIAASHVKALNLVNMASAASPFGNSPPVFKLFYVVLEAKTTSIEVNKKLKAALNSF